MTWKLEWVIASAITLSGIGAGTAADMAVKAPPAVPAAIWSGWYAGLNIGAAINDSTDTVSPTGCFVSPTILCGGPLTNNPLRTDSARLSGPGFTAGGQLGYNWQAGNWLFGIETDINYNGLRDSNSVIRLLSAPLIGSFVHTETDRIDWFGTLRGRIGWTVTPAVLLYATGGLAYGQVQSSSSNFFTATGDSYLGSIDTTRVGWTAGGGGEWMIAANWSVKAEYLFVDLGTVRYTDVCVGVPACGAFASPPTYQTDLRAHEHVARIGFNYKFGGPTVERH